MSGCARRRAYVSAANRRAHPAERLPSRFVDDCRPSMSSAKRDRSGSATGERPHPNGAHTAAAQPAGERGGVAFHQRERLCLCIRCRPRVFMKFGYGTVASVDGDKLDIEFDKAGRKKVMASSWVPAEKAG
jgi:DNA helicase-2/ATP-dependent DNA helicase PcrA